MAWLRLELDADRALVPPLEALFEAAGATALSLADARDEPLLEPGPGETPLWQSVRLQALFADDRDPDALLELTGAAWLGATGAALPDVRVSVLDDADWVDAWRQHARELRFAEALRIQPADDDGAADAAAASFDGATVLLPPGLAFGTGSHPTTRLCLQWLASHPPHDLRVLDFGCGSGVLALAALALGAAAAVGVDHDPQALQASADNAGINGCADQLTLHAVLPPQSVFDVVLANVLAGPLMALAQPLTAAVVPGGRLLLTGILDDQRTTVAAAYPGFTFETLQDEGWSCLVGTREPA